MSSLQSINFSSFNTTNVKDMNGMLFGCSSLKSIDLSLFNTTNVNSMVYMFRGCSSLKKKNIRINKLEKRILNELKNNK